MGSGSYWGAQAQSKKDSQHSGIAFHCPRGICAWQVVPVVHCTPFVAPLTLKFIWTRDGCTNLHNLMQWPWCPVLPHLMICPDTLDIWMLYMWNLPIFKFCQLIQFFKIPLEIYIGNSSYHKFKCNLIYNTWGKGKFILQSLDYSADIQKNYMIRATSEVWLAKSLE